MSSRAFDDREHRRGLVLGLTLAEVLLLLLFLLLLALFWRLNDLRTDLRDAEGKLVSSEQNQAKLKDQLDALAPIASKLEADGLTVDVKRLGELAVIVGKDSATIDAVRELVVQAVKVNPQDPPAVLRTAARILEIAKTDPAFSQLEAVVNTSNADSVNPIDALQEAVELSAATKKALAEAGVTQLDAKAIASLIVQGAKSGAGEHDWPPIISLKDADGYRFQTGSAELSPEFVGLLKTGVVEQVKGMVAQYDVDVVEVIGHTDEQPIASRLSNLDERLVGVFRNDGDAIALVPADNAGLGIARAAAVAKVLISDPTLLGLRILPLSGAQLIDNGDRLTAGRGGDVRERRRIEIRVRRSAEWSPRH